MKNEMPNILEFLDKLIDEENGRIIVQKNSTKLR
jgi:hypothetical protein